VKNFSLSLTTKRDFDEQINKLLSANPSQPLYVNVTKKEKKRGLSANAQQHVFYAQIAKFYGDRTALEVKNSCKDLFGLPILLASHEQGDKLEFILHKLDYYKHSYESKMKLISCLSITSEFTTKESRIYMDDMIYYFNELDININYQD